MSCSRCRRAPAAAASRATIRKRTSSRSAASAEFPKGLGISTSKKMFAPRVGFAYRLNNATVIRSGYGITYNPMPLARPLRGFFPLVFAATFNSANSFQPVRTLEQGIPDIVLPDISSGRVPLPATAAMRFISGDELQRGYVQSWNFIIERQLPGQIIDIDRLRRHADRAQLRRPGDQRRGSRRRHRRTAAERALRTQRRHLGVERLSQRQLSCAAGRRQSPGGRRAAAEGRLHLLEGHQLHRRRRLDRHDHLELGAGLRPQSRAGRLQHPHTSSRSDLSTSCRPAKERSSPPPARPAGSWATGR